MSLRKHDWKKGKYSSDSVDLLDEHVLPMLRYAVRYDRSVAYLKSSHLNEVALSILQFVERGGRARYLIGDPLDKDTYDALSVALNSNQETAYIEKCYQRLREALSHADASSQQDLPLLVLQYLIACGKLELQIIIRKGLHHEKVRIAEDSDGNTVVICGSDNDSESALSGSNRESGVVMTSWDYAGTDYWETHGFRAVNEFERDWSNQNDNAMTLPLTSEIMSRIADDWASRQISREELWRRVKAENTKGEKFTRPLRPYQADAIQAWRESDYQGIMALCTGAGKTFTAISAAIQLAEHHTENNRPFYLVVAVPYRILAFQWKDELEKFFPDVVGCSADFPDWLELLSARILSGFANGEGCSNLLVVVVVNDTLRGRDFQKCLASIPKDNLCWIGDEVHQHASIVYDGKIPDARYILGLSATPWSSGETEKATALSSKYGSVVAEFSIGDALDAEVLVPYDYISVAVTLSENETIRYGKVSSELAKLSSRIATTLSAADEKKLKSLIRKRASILGMCKEKLNFLQEFARANRMSETLIYCPEGKYMDPDTGYSCRALDHIAQIFSSNGWGLSKITAGETSRQRKQIIEALTDRLLDAVLAMRVLDEGFDLPIVKNAIILSSSRNERQFIQRRGRVLRPHPKKASATIYDFFVTPHPHYQDEKWGQTLRESEAIRAWEFGRFATNKGEIETMLDETFRDCLHELRQIQEAVETRSYSNELSLVGETLDG